LKNRPLVDPIYIRRVIFSFATEVDRLENVELDHDTKTSSKIRREMLLGRSASVRVLASSACTSPILSGQHDKWPAKIHPGRIYVHMASIRAPASLGGSGQLMAKTYNSWSNPHAHGIG